VKFIKVIYFDESSVADFIQIVAGGALKRTTEFISEVNTSASADVNAEAGIGSGASKGLPKLFEFLGVKLGASMKQTCMAMLQEVAWSKIYWKILYSQTSQT